MSHPFFVFLMLGSLLAAFATKTFAEDAKEEAIKKDRKQIEGIWRIVALQVDGNKSEPEDAKKFTVVNGADGTWILRDGDKEIAKGTSTIDPTKKPKTIDFELTAGEGKGDRYHGIYELGGTARKLCFGPAGGERPTEFSSKSGSQYIFVTFEREKSK